MSMSTNQPARRRAPCAEAKKKAGWSVFWRREFSGLPVYVGVEEGYVKRTAPMDKRQFMIPRDLQEAWL